MGIFSAKGYDKRFLAEANQLAGGGHELVFLEARLARETATLGADYPAVCAFVNDKLDAEVLRVLAAGATRLVVLRCAGFNNVDVVEATRLGLRVARVPAYSPHAVAEHTVGLILMLMRRLSRAVTRVRDGNFALDGLLGTELHGRTIGIVGTGRIGATTARALSGFGVQLLATDVRPDPACVALGVRYVPLEELLAAAHVVTLHCPLTPDTRHLIDAARLAQMRPGALLVNTSRGALIDTPALIAALKTGRLGGVAMDVYEEEEHLFFEDHSTDLLLDDTFARLLTFPNVIVTGHQAFFTEEALRDISRITIANLDDFQAGRPCEASARVA